MANQAVCVVGAVLWAAAVVSYQRRVRQACANCGRNGSSGAGAAAGALRWGRRAVVVACVIPVGHWGATVPEMFWPLWGVALGVATVAYYLRRRGRCRICGKLRPGSGAVPGFRIASVRPVLRGSRNTDQAAPAD